MDDHDHDHNRAPGLPDPAAFCVLETTLYAPGEGLRLLPEHLARMRASAACLAAAYRAPCFVADPAALDPDRVRAQALAAVAGSAAGPRARHRVRLLLDRAGRLAVQATPEPPEPPAAEPVPLFLDSEPSDTDSPFVRCKTTFRALYDRATARLPPTAPPGAQVLLHNAHGRITEATVANVAVSLPAAGDDDDDDKGRLELVTPPLADGLLPGTMRQHLLDAGAIREGPVTVAQFRHAAASGWPIVCMNSVRGMYLVAPHV
ncbi:hypothetical protein H4R18_005053 [Coemansia javaensis]|uniref:Branched-chain-amino-acid aminotransferase n=1 Tax=Coemansia javaensis TaxID=2761396 RepID=A0A9W8H370_9FUNG|nr:hypothetical protein H4R18_005053 [Coemansia javaensis]